MDFFDISAGWAVLAPFPLFPAAEDLARCIAALRKRDGLDKEAPPILDAAGPAPEDSIPVVVLNRGDGLSDQGGHAWRIGRGRVEIYGDSLRGLCNGIYAFLGALGFSWPEPAGECLPPRQEDRGAGPGIYPLPDRSFLVRSDPAPERRRRLVVPSSAANKEIPLLGRWAARNRIDALVFSLRDRRFPGLWGVPGFQRTARSRVVTELENNWGLVIERGGWDLSALVPRRLFFFKRELFRMEGGRRIQSHHFCPTNPEAIALLRRLPLEKAAEGADRPPRIYHLWPDRGAEHLWCACPACRAFMPREQIRLAVNAAAAAAVEKDPLARISCRGEEEEAAEKLPGGSEVVLHPSVFRLDRGSAVYLYENGRIKEMDHGSI
jgi:hypothetical protein